MKQMKILMVSAMLCCMPLMGCAALVKALPTIVQYVQDAVLILDQVDAVAGQYIERSSNEELKKDYARAMQTARQSLQVALRTSKGSEDLSREEVDKAFEEFREAYKELLAVLQRAGVMDSSGTMSASPDLPALELLEPMALQPAE